MAALRFPSLSHLADRAGVVARRFPWTIVAAFAAAGFAIASTYGHDRPQDALVRAAFVAVLGLPATIALALLAEVRRRGETARLLWPAVGLALLVVFYLTWPGPEAKHDMIRYLQLAAVLHLAVAVLPFLGTEESVGFWQYNRFLFVGFLRAVVFSAVLFIGAAVALGAVDKLFGVHVPGEAYARIWFFMAFVVNTWIFLAAVPDDISALVYETNYPRPLKVFAQYVLTPLAFTYLIILLAYLVKLVTGAEWPSGWVGWLVTSVAVTGLLGFLLVHPLRGEPGEGWIRIYARWLFVGLTPAAIMLLVAFAKRIVPYGLTEPRVLGIVLGLWLLGIALLYTFRPGTGIRIVPLSLAVTLLVTLYGPISLTSISIRSQEHRLHGAIADAINGAGHARDAAGPLEFLLRHRAGAAIAAATGRPLPRIAWDSVTNYAYRDSIQTSIMAEFGPAVLADFRGDDELRGFSATSNRLGATELEGFAWLVRVSDDDTAQVAAGDQSFSTAFDRTSGLARLHAGSDTFTFDLTALVKRIPADSLARQTPLPPELLTADASTGSRRARLRLDQIMGTRKGDSVSVTGWNGEVLVGK